jgi:hypothetical protein
MCSSSFFDLDGHGRQVMWMDPPVRTVPMTPTFPVLLGQRHQTTATTG